MHQWQLELALAEAQKVTGEKEFIVIGSCSVLSQFPEKGEVLTKLTRDIDIYPKHYPEKTEMLYVLGINSDFDDKNNFYVEGVGPTTAVLPKGWEDRLVKFSNENTNQAIGWCLEVHDLTVAKLAAHRGKDLEFIEGLLAKDLVKPDVIRARLEQTQFDHSQTKNMATDHFEQCVENAARIKKKETIRDFLDRNNQTGLSKGPENDIGPELER